MKRRNFIASIVGLTAFPFASKAKALDLSSVKRNDLSLPTGGIEGNEGPIGCEGSTQDEINRWKRMAFNEFMRKDQFPPLKPKGE